MSNRGRSYKHFELKFAFLLKKRCNLTAVGCYLSSKTNVFFFFLDIIILLMLRKFKSDGWFHVFKTKTRNYLKKNGFPLKPDDVIVMP